MNTLEIKQKLEENKHTKAIFQNVYAVDQLPREKIRQDRWLLVVNCCPIKRKGEHWICIYGDKDAGIDFFDSFGFSPVEYDKKITQFFHRQGYPGIDVKFNATRLQDFNSDACGHFCIMFACQRALGRSMGTIVERLKRITRDAIVKLLVDTTLDLEIFSELF